MIINDTHEFAFVHIPKCAGTTVRERLARYDETGGRFASGRVDMHPDLGMLDYVHISLPTLRDYFPNEFDKLKRYQTFALVRDPLERFQSSLAQRLRAHKNLTIMPTYDREIQIYVDDIISNISNKTVITDPKFIHFERQSNFLKLNDEIFIKTIVPVEHVNRLLIMISGVIGENIVTSKISNETKIYRSDTIRSMVEGLKEIIPISFLNYISNETKNLIRNYIHKKPDIADFERLLDERQLRFIHEYYVTDFRLYEEISINYRANEL